MKAPASRNPSTTTFNAVGDDHRGTEEEEEEEERRKRKKQARKRIHLIRHGVTHMNMYLTKNPYGSRGFRDPLDFDTKLTPRGVEQARSLSRRTAELLQRCSSSGSATPSSSSSSNSSSNSSSSPSFVVVVSPLTRALQTATLAFPSLVDESRNRREEAAKTATTTAATTSATATTTATTMPTMTSLALARERVWLSSDVGRPRSSLAAEFPHVCFADLPPCDSPWWHGGAEAAEGRVELEPLGAFRRRVARLRGALLSRPEEEVALVSHAGVLEALTGGRFFHNCELVSVTGEELLRVDIVGGGGGGGGGGGEGEEDGVEGDDGFLF